MQGLFKGVVKKRAFGKKMKNKHILILAARQATVWWLDETVLQNIEYYCMLAIITSGLYILNPLFEE